MKVIVRMLAAAVLLAALSMALIALPALAQEDGEPPTETSQPTEATQPLPEVTVQPAVPVTAAPDDEAQLDWTYRYMIPTVLVLGVLVIVITAGQYFVSVVRKRYRIVEE
jgi:hypothetical protein